MGTVQLLFGGVGQRARKGKLEKEVGRRFLSSFSCRPLNKKMTIEERKENYKKYYRERRDEMLARRKQYHKEYYKKYYREHKDEMLARSKQYRETHRDEVLAHDKLYYQKNRDHFKQYYEQNKDKEIQQVKAWCKNHREQYREIERRHKSKRERNLGFIPLNKPFEGCEAHHINQKYIIYIPRELHQSIHHDLMRGTNMLIINALAVEYLQGESFENETCDIW